MWLIENHTAFAAERGWVRDRNGGEVWLVAVKCTFDIKPDGSTQVSMEQPPVLRVPEYRGEPGTSSMAYECDLVLTKTTTDVSVIGHACAPNEKPVTEIEAGFRLGSINKVVRVTGDRVWTRLGMTSPKPFTRIPLVYERAFGGVDRRSEHPDRDWDWRNPVGTGFAVAPDNLVDVPLPNIEYPNDVVRTWKDRPRPAGFGPISGHWLPRARLAGTYDDSWTQNRQPLLPDDFNDRFFQSVPEDQQPPAFLVGGEPVAVHHLTPGGDLRFQLPRMVLGFETHFYGGLASRQSSARLHSVIIEPDHPRVSLVWHSALPCHALGLRLARTTVTVDAPDHNATARSPIAAEA